MLKNWRSWVLLALFFGPFLAYMGMGLLWLKEQGWAWVSAAGLISVAAGVAFTLLMNRWTKSKREFLPPIDWEAPQTFSDFDRKAWELVEAEAERGESLEMATLTSIDTYIETGKRLASRLAAHYHPLSADPIDRDPRDRDPHRAGAGRRGPVGALPPGPRGRPRHPADWKKAVVAANYIQKASDLYTYLLPMFNPVTGLSRLASQHLMVKPAWKNMQQNVLRWFHRAFVNRMGTHLVELYSGRLVIGAEGYRKLSRKLRQGTGPTIRWRSPLTIAVAGAKHSGKSTLIKAIEGASRATSTALGGRIVGLGRRPRRAGDRLKGARLVEVDSLHRHTRRPSRPATARPAGTRSRRRRVRPPRSSSSTPGSAPRGADTAFLEAWAKWYADHPALTIPPALAVLTHVDSPGFGGEWKPPHDWIRGTDRREVGRPGQGPGPPRRAPRDHRRQVVPAASAVPASRERGRRRPAPLTALCHKAPSGTP